LSAEPEFAHRELDHRERGLEDLAGGTEHQRRRAVHHVAEAQRHDHDRHQVLLERCLHHHPLQQQADQHAAAHRQRDREQVGELEPGDREPGDEAADHVHLAMPEVDEPGHAQQDGPADGHQGICVPQHQAVDDLLRQVHEPWLPR
jgi:hypothetical protein